MNSAHFILYVQNQDASCRFYKHVLSCEPSLHVPGMTQFELPGGSTLGLMPERGIQRLLGAALPDPAAGRGVPRAELYLIVKDPDAYHQRALVAGAKELSKLAPRDWGDEVVYSLDLDSHVLAFAGEKLE